MANLSNFAEPTVSAGGARTKNFKLEGGSNLYRIGPAFASLAPSGRWNVNIRQHYGYRSSGDDKNPSGFIRTFLCPEEKDRKTEMVKVRCPECEDIAALREKVDLREQKLVAEDKSEAEIDTILGPQKKYLKEHNLDKKHLVLAKNQAGEWGVLWLPWKALEALLNLREKTKENDGFDILSIKEGAWIDFMRNGEGFRNTSYACDLVYETTVLDNGKKAKTPKQEALTEADFDLIESSCPDLSTVGTKLTVEQIERLVESRGDTEVVDAIFNEAREVKKGRKEASPAPVKKVEPKVEVKPKVEQKIEKVETTESREKPVVVQAEEDDEEAKLMAQLAALKAKKQAEAKQAEVKVEKKVEKEPEIELSPDQDPDDLPDDQFIGVFGKKK